MDNLLVNPDLVRVPPRHAPSTEIYGNPIDQILIRSQSAPIEVNGDSFAITLDTGHTVPMVSTEIALEQQGCCFVLPDDIFASLPVVPNLMEGRWQGGEFVMGEPAQVRQSLEDAFRFIEEDTPRSRKGLRPPQLGATHAVLGYWSTKRSDPATVVMPTGTGKTETMLALWCAGRVDRLLVLVPSDALRTQIADKFLSLGILQEFNVLSPNSQRPIVGQVKHAFPGPDEALAFAERCNVIVATPPALRASDQVTREAIYSCCSHLFIDEAHHVAAQTWTEIRRKFVGKPIVQFTATPFREDDKRLGGKIIYSFPLREAQQLRYFSGIDYISVMDFYDQDRAIATAAVERLRADVDAGFDHLLMARTNQKTRANELLPLYRELAPEFQPMVLYSGISQTAHQARLTAMRSKQSRIVICVDMLGEGFDMPELKIAAIHDPHKSLGVTLQFVGRFSRDVPDRLGRATVVTGRPNGEFDERLRRLYAQDADWNDVIQELSLAVIEDEEEVTEFEAAFNQLPDEVPLRSLLPKMSTVIYRTEDIDWNPDGFYAVYPAESVLTEPLPINDQANVMWSVVEQRSPVEWGDLEVLENVVYDLYVLYHDHARCLLYINSSHDALHEDVAKAVCGESATRITGENVYRVLAEVKRMTPTNIGVLDTRDGRRRFSMHVGSDVTDGLAPADRQTKTKTNLFAYGYENGRRVSIGASQKGRIWSYRVAKTLKHWVDWCDGVGTKLLDDTIDIDELMRHFILPVVLTERPSLVALGAEWSWELFANVRDEFQIEYGGIAHPVIDVSLDVRSHEVTGPIELRVVSSDWQLDYDLVIANGRMQFTAVGADAILLGSRRFETLSEYLNANGLLLYFEKEAIVTPDALLLQPNRNLPPYDPNELIALEWTNVNMSIESQIDNGQHRPESVQAYMIEQVRALANWDVVLDDDIQGEIADIVAMRVEGNELIIHLTHCKFVSGWEEGKDRRRVTDLYEVCCQAMKSARWRRSVDELFMNLIRRQRQYFERNGVSGIVVGTERRLLELEDQARLLKYQFVVAIAQPGLQKLHTSPQQLELLAAAQCYVQDVTAGRFVVFCA